MKSTLIILLYCTACLMAEQEETRDLIDGIEDSEDLERKHRKKKKKHQQANPCGYGGYGKSFGSYDYTYVSAPVMNYFFGCGSVPVAPVVPQYAPIQPYPVQFGGGHSGHGGHGHGAHGGHGGGHGGGGHGGGGQDFYGAQPVYAGSVQGYQGFNQYPGQYRPFQNAVSAAASGFGSALAGYFSRPRKAQRQINQLLRPVYKLF